MPPGGDLTQNIQSFLPQGGAEVQAQQPSTAQPAQSTTGPAIGGVAGPMGNPIDQRGPIGGSAMGGLASMQGMPKGARRRCLCRPGSFVPWTCL